MSRDIYADPSGETAALWAIVDCLRESFRPQSVLVKTAEQERADEEQFLAAAEEVAQMRVRFAEAFLLRKAKSGVSDRQAHEQAIVDTQSQLDVALARQEIARRCLTDRQPT